MVLKWFRIQDWSSLISEYDMKQNVVPAGLPGPHFVSYLNLRHSYAFKTYDGFSDCAPGKNISDREILS